MTELEFGDSIENKLTHVIRPRTAMEIRRRLRTSTKYYKMTGRSKVYVDVKPLKKFAYERLPDCPLKRILLLEDDTLDIHTFLARIPVWLNLTKVLER